MAHIVSFGLYFNSPKGSPKYFTRHDNMRTYFLAYKISQNGGILAQKITVFTKLEKVHG